MTHLKTFATCAALAAMALPAGAVASGLTPDTTPTASQQCKTLRTQMGAAAFGEAYGTNAGRTNALGKCTAKLAKAQETGKAAAVSACRAEEAADAAAFKAKYGTGKNGANASGKCVSSKARASAAAAKGAELRASAACKAERALDKAAFAAKYGTNARKSNAFGKCVSAKAKAKVGTAA